MISVSPLNTETVDAIAALYEAFRAEAQTTYQWEHEPVDFETLKKAIAHGMIHGYKVDDTAAGGPVAFMLYVREDHRALEINLIYIPDAARNKTVTDRLFRRFLADAKTIPGWDVISYAMLGPQSELALTMPWYGFRLVGQAIVKFDIMNPISLQILKQKPIETPEGYRLDQWRPEYAGDVSKVVLDAFSQATDALWDPRFRTELGARKVVGMLAAGDHGHLIPECTSVLFKDDKPVGFCFLVQATMMQGNIPLIGVGAGHHRKRLGHLLLQHTLNACVDNILAGNIGMVEVSATHDTDNLSAIAMYRHLGFKDHAHYPHACLSHEKMQQMVVGQWC